MSFQPVKTPPRAWLLEAARTLEMRAQAKRQVARQREEEMDFRLYEDPKASAIECRELADRLDAVARWLDYSVDGPRAQAAMDDDEKAKP